MKENYETRLQQADRDRLDDWLDQIEAFIIDKLAAMTEAQRVSYGSINEQNKLLVNKVREMRENNPAMSSPDVDWAAFEEDYQARQFLDTRGDRFARIASLFKSTKIRHDYDNYQDALADYAYSQYRKGAGEAGFTEKVAELKQFFPKSSKMKTPEEGENE
ncbi:MAG TPA: hypothetical protein PKY59_01440 [Pyrinomonadaceae bacterium]|nr:hypothetical protein [Pyrinomonadaceae bacterium]